MVSKHVNPRPSFRLALKVHAGYPRISLAAPRLRDDVSSRSSNEVTVQLQSDESS